MNKLLKDLNIDETYTRKTKSVLDRVKQNTLPVSKYNYMADILYLPQTRQKFKYLLTMVDLWSNKCDFEPMKNKTADTTLQAMKAIFKRGILPMPKGSIRTDSGTEFHGVFHKYLYNHNILQRFAQPYRHQQMGNVEKLNYDLGRIFNGYMNTEEMKKGQTFREWTNILNLVRTEINKIRIGKKDENPFETKFLDVKIDSKYDVGDLVYYRSDVPLDALGHRQDTANFRVGDYRFNIWHPKKIKKILYYPKNVRYLLDGMLNVSFAESELKPANEKNTTTNPNKRFKMTRF